MKKEKKVVQLDSHKLSSFQACEQRYVYAHRDNLQFLTTKLSGMAKGTLWHQIMEKHYQLIQQSNLYSTVKNETKDYLCSIVPEDLRADFLAKYILYAHRYNKYIDREILGCEIGFDKILYEDERYLFIYQGKIDLLLRNKEKIMWVDFKTRHPMFTKPHHHFCNQFLGYSWAVGTDTGIIDYLTWHKQVKPDTLKRDYVHHPKSKLDAWKSDTISWFFKVARMQEPLRNRSSCDQKYSCPFIKLCDENDLTKYEQEEPWVPWKLEGAGIERKEN